MDGLTYIATLRKTHGLRNPDTSSVGPFAVPTEDSRLCYQLQENKYFRPFCTCSSLLRMGRTHFGFECSNCKRQLDWMLTPIPRGSR